MMMYDIIIVGAGIGGATAAYFLGQAGLRVLVIEKETLPRYKPCGGGVPRTALELFPFSFESVLECEVNSVRYSFRGQHEFSMPVPAHAVAMVMRDRLDYHVLQQARADVVEGEKVAAVQEDCPSTGDTSHCTRGARCWSAMRPVSWIPC